MSAEQYAKCKGTMFKKGQQPINHRPVGSERITRDGYVEIKVAEPNVWKLRHRYIWEMERGEVPTGYKLVSLNGDKTTTDINNMILVTNDEMLYMNNNALCFKVPELTKAGALVAKLERAAKKKE